MNKDKQKIQISKFLSLVLRHKPDTIGLVLDKNGWASVGELLKRSNTYGIVFDLDTLKEVVRTNDKKRFAFNSEFDKIRASQGHSLNVDLGYSGQEPPELLYHGTAQRYIASILRKGLVKQKRQYVHLSSELQTAIKVGQRHGKPAVLKVDADKMSRDGYIFYISENGVWLTDNVPPPYLNIKEIKD